MSATFTPSGPEVANLPSATPVPSAQPTALPAPVPFYAITNLTLPSSITRDIGYSQYQYYALQASTGLIRVTFKPFR